MWHTVKSTEYAISPEIMFIVRIIFISIGFKIVLIWLFKIDWFKIRWTYFLKKYKKNKHERN